MLVSRYKTKKMPGTTLMVITDARGAWILKETLDWILPYENSQNDSSDVHRNNRYKVLIAFLNPSRSVS
jgi:hypothetical protein